MRKTILVALGAASLLGACTTTERVSVVQPGDRVMTCTQLKDEFIKLDEIIRDGKSDQGVNGANVASVLFFWPAAVGNYFSARDATEIAERRREHLMVFYNEKNCDAPGNAQLRIQIPAELLGPIAGMH